MGRRLPKRVNALTMLAGGAPVNLCAWQYSCRCLAIGAGRTADDRALMIPGEGGGFFRPI
jgi:hypothetical protein